MTGRPASLGLPLLNATQDSACNTEPIAPVVGHSHPTSPSAKRLKQAKTKRFSMGVISDVATFGAQVSRSITSSEERKAKRCSENWGRQSTPLGDGIIRDRLAGRCQPVSMSPQTLEQVKAAINEHSVSLFLEPSDVETIAKKMQYYTFEAGEIIIRAGEKETHLMVSLEASIRVDLGEDECSELPCGVLFGSSSLLYTRERNSTVQAVADCGIWGADGGEFRQMLRETASRRSKANALLLESIELFKLFSVRQRELISRALHAGVFQKGSLVVGKDRFGRSVSEQSSDEDDGIRTSHTRLPDLEEEDATMWCVKEGRLRAVDPITGEELFKIQVGDSFGERCLLHKEALPFSVYADADTEVLLISNSLLKPILGMDFGDFLKDHIITSALRSGPVCANYSQTQRDCIARQFQFKIVPPMQPLGTDFSFVVVISGEIQALSSGDNGNTEHVVKFTRGQFHSLLKDDMGVSADSGNARLHNFVAGPDGASYGILTKASLIGALDQADEAQVTEYTRKIMALKKVPLFRYLSHDQISKLEKNLAQVSKAKGDFVIEQGSLGDSFYVLAKGEVTVTINGKLIRTMAKNAYFGERALLFSEPRTASIQVTSDDGAELWSVDKAHFDSVITEHMREDVMQRIIRQDTKAQLVDLKIVRGIGHGISGVVRLVEHRKTRTRYALKYVDKTNKAIVKEIQQECALLGENDHPFIMNVVRTFETKGRVYMLTELVTGGDLHGAIRQFTNCLTRPQAAFYTASLVIVLEALWDRNIVFRDLKPENVMIDMHGYIKLIDFGVAKKLGAGGRTFTTIGTPHYMAPEVLASKGYSSGCDLWSLGVMLYEFVIGRLPFGNDLEEPAQVFAAVLEAKLEFPARYRDEAGREIMQDLLCFDPEKRLGTGLRGYDDVRRARYFLQKGSNDHELFFNQIMGRELDAPFVPEAEIFPSDSEGEMSEGSHVTDLNDEQLDEQSLVSLSSKNARLTTCCSCFSFLRAR